MKKRAAIRSLIVVFIVMIEICCVVLYQHSSVQINISNAYQELDDSARMQTKVFMAKFNGHYAIIESFASTLSDRESFNTPDIISRMNAVVNTKSNEFINVSICGTDGIYYTNDGRSLVCSDRDYFKKAMKGEKSIQKINNARLEGDSRFVMTVPIFDGDKVIGTVLGSMSIDGFEKLLISESFDRNSFSVLTDSDGKIMLSYENFLSMEKGTAVFELLENGNVSEEKMQKIKSDFKNESDGNIQYSKNGEGRLAVYRYLGINDWMIINVVPKSVIDKRCSDQMQMGWIVIAVTVIGMFALMMQFVIRERREVLAEEDRKIQLMLSQIKPHFLYNTLSAIRALIKEEPDTASKLVYDFSKYLRNNIDSLTTNKLIEFKDELNHIKSYTEIEKIRFKGEINVVFDIQEDDFCVPPLSIQPLVENAIKHGLHNKKGGGTVTVKTSKDSKDYVITVEDDGVGFDKCAKDDIPHSSTGLKNVEYRLQRMCKGNLSIVSQSDSGTVVTVKIPIKEMRDKNENHIGR